MKVDVNKMREKVAEKGITRDFWHVREIMEAIHENRKEFSVLSVVEHKDIHQEMNEADSYSKLAALTPQNTNISYHLLDDGEVFHSLDLSTHSLNVEAIDESSMTYCHGSTDSHVNVKEGDFFVASELGAAVHSNVAHNRKLAEFMSTDEAVQKNQGITTPYCL